MSKEAKEKIKDSEEESVQDEDNTWAIHRLRDMDLSKCTRLQIQSIIAQQMAISKSREIFDKVYKDSMASLEKGSAYSEDELRVYKHALETEKSKLPFPFKEYQEILSLKFEELKGEKSSICPNFDLDKLRGSLSQVIKKEAGKEESVRQTILSHIAPTLTSLEPANLIKFISLVRTHQAKGFECTVSAWIPKGAIRTQLYWQLKLRKIVETVKEFEDNLDDTERFLKMSDEMTRLLSLPQGQLSDTDLIRQHLKFKFQLVDDDIDAIIKQFAKFQSENAEMVENEDEQDQTVLVLAFIETNLKGGISSAQRVLFQYLKDLREPKIKFIKHAFELLIEEISSVKKSCNIAYSVGMRFMPETDHGPSPKTIHPKISSEKMGGGGSVKNTQGEKRKELYTSSEEIIPKKARDVSARDEETCKLCGIRHHSAKNCRLKDEDGPYYNKEAVVDYDKSKAWAKCLQDHPNILKNKIVDYPRAPSGKHLAQLGENSGKNSSKRVFKGMSTCACMNMIFQHSDDCDYKNNSTIKLKNIDEYVTMITDQNSPYPFNYTEIIIPRKKILTGGSPDIIVPTRSLIDTGALNGNYVGTWIIKHGVSVIGNNLNRQICSPINDSCISVTDSVLVCVSIFDKDKINNFKIEIELKILSSLDDKEYGMIIGLPDIKKHGLLNKLASQFDREEDFDMRKLKRVSIRKELIGYSKSNKFAIPPIGQGVGSVGRGLKSSMSPSAHTRTTINSAQTATKVDGEEDMLGTTHETIMSESRPVFRSQIYDEDDEVIPYDHWDDAWQKNDIEGQSNEEDILDMIVSKINSEDPMFKSETRAFLEDYRDLFSRTLSATPAALPPLEIEVDSKKFMTKASQGPPRMMTAEKESHIRKFITEGLESDIIRPSNAAYYSQVHLVVKPTNDAHRAHGANMTSTVEAKVPRKWRTTIDYRFFNQCITPQHWPLPNISQMLQRIGKAKPKYFAKLDMTSGYWQAPLAENTKRFTAFITFMGIFEWNRAPMGTQPAGGYFHQCIAFIVLAGLVYTILESYIDDILLHAQTKKEFWENLTKVFQRFKQFRITFNPDKVFFSDSTMEFVGHEISHDGIQFSSKKKSGVQDIPVPATKGDLKKFLGVANYFRDHVRNHSLLAQPLSAMLPAYVRGHRNHKLNWTDEQKITFYALRDAVANSPKLYFINEIWEIGLETDASDYGIGAFLYQINPETQEKVPVQFVSKSLTGAQLRWSTPEKEMYARYFAVKKLEYMLGDVPFTWYTDHKNNTLTRNTGSDKVLRWDLYLQQFDCTKKYLKGEDNEITDTWSRLCAVSDKTEYLTRLEEMEAPAPQEYLNLMTETVMTLEEVAVLAQPRVLSPETYRKLAKVHNSQVGHLGVERTMARLKRLDDMWEGMRADIILFIKQCPCCQKMSRIKVPIHTSPFTAASYGLMKKLSMDCMGPLKLTDDEYTHILVIIDNFSRYAALYPIKGVTALEIAKMLLRHIGIFGCPEILQMDNGTEFINETVKEVIKLVGTSSAAILAYSKEENAIVERCNKEVMRHIQAMVFEINKRNAWDTYLPLAQRIINSEIHSRIGVSPNDLVFGGKVDLQGGFLTTPIVQSQNVNISTWSSEMINLQNKLVDIAQKRQIEQDEAFIQKRHENINVSQFRPNSFVLVQYPNSAMGARAPSKLHTHWKGPMRVVSNKGAEYTVRDLVQDKDILVHVKRLKVFEYDPLRHDPLAIAAKDYEEDEVESIIRHTGDPKRKSSMDFLVRWQGYDESEDLWLPWSALRTNVALHTYLRANNLEKLIPK